MENSVELWKKSAKLWITFSNFRIFKKLSLTKSRDKNELLTARAAGQAYIMQVFLAICLQNQMLIRIDFSADVSD